MDFNWHYPLVIILYILTVSNPCMLFPSDLLRILAARSYNYYALQSYDNRKLGCLQISEMKNNKLINLLHTFLNQKK